MVTDAIADSGNLRRSLGSEFWRAGCSKRSGFGRDLQRSMVF